MNQIVKTITLPTDDNGRYILTREAVSLIKNADQLIAKYTTRDAASCSFRIIIKRTIEGEHIGWCYDLPINVSGPYQNSDMRFKAVIYTKKHINCFHPVQALVKKGYILSFEPSPEEFTTEFLNENDIKGEAILFRIETPSKKIVIGHFDEYIGSVSNTYFLHLKS